MSKIKFILASAALVFVLGFTANISAQNGPVLYFCEDYSSAGETGIGDRFYTGKISVARVLAFEDLGMEAIREFELEDFPVTVAVDARGISIHRFAVTQAAVAGT